MNEKQDFFALLSPRSALLVGITGGILALGTIGFFVLGSTMLFGDSAGAVAGVKTNVAQAAPTPTAAPAPSGNVAPPAVNNIAEGIPPITDEDHIRGNPNAPLTFIEYSDIECPYCKRLHPTMQRIMDDYDGKIKWIYRHYPLSFHPNADREAEATECMAELGGNDLFWSYLDTLFERTTSNGNGIRYEQLAPIAAEFGINQDVFQDCLDSRRYQDKIANQLATGQAAGVTGTPGSFFIDAEGNGRLVAGAVPYETIKAMIDEALN